MHRILDAFSLFTKLCGKQKPTDREMKLSTFVLKTPCEDGTLLYHTASGELLLLSDTEMESCSDSADLRSYLFDRWFLVPTDFDEYKMASDFRKIAAMFQPKKEEITSFTIFPTTDCNARCFYCYELGRKRLHMTDKVADDAADYIQKVSKGQNVELVWFGGEPLYNLRAIDRICEKLSDLQVLYTSKMVSNAYLLDENVLIKAIKLWHLSVIQIPIDGTQTVYNKTKAYIYGDKNAYNRVLENVKRLLDSNIRVVIRLNLNKENENDLYQLVNELSERFADSPKKPELYVVLLKDFGHDSRQFPNFYDAIEACDKLNRFVISKNLSRIPKLRRELPMNKCMADNPHSVTILPDGRLGKCEHESEKMLIGSIYEDAVDTKTLQAWSKKIEIPECRQCVFAPVCINLTHCAWDCEGCTEADRKLKASNLQRIIHNEYLLWKEHQT